MTKVYEADITDFSLDDHNANRGTERGSEEIEQSLRDLGAGRSIVVDRAGKIPAGNKTVQAAQAAGITKAIVIETTGDAIIVHKRNDWDLDDPDVNNPARQYAYRDNLTQVHSFDIDPAQVKFDLDAGMDLSAVFKDSELDAILAELEGDDPLDDPGAQIDKAAELQEKWGVQLGQIWQCDDHFVICGDCREISTWKRLLGAAGVVMEKGEPVAIVTDPPYGINRTGVVNDDPEGLRKLFDGVLAAMPITDAVVIAFQSPRLFPVWLDAIRAAGHKFERMLWMYKSNDETFPWRGWLLKSEAILVSSLGKGEWLEVKPYAHDCYSPTKLGSELPKKWGKAHATVKPLSVVQDLISRVGGIVYDSFLGSGTTMVGCENLGRKCRACEIIPACVAVALERMSGSGLTAKLIS